MCLIAYSFGILELTQLDLYVKTRDDISNHQDEGTSCPSGLFNTMVSRQWFQQNNFKAVVSENKFRRQRVHLSFSIPMVDCDEDSNFQKGLKEENLLFFQTKFCIKMFSSYIKQIKAEML